MQTIKHKETQSQTGRENIRDMFPIRLRSSSIHRPIQQKQILPRLIPSIPTQRFHNNHHHHKRVPIINTIIQLIILTTTTTTIIPIRIYSNHTLNTTIHHNYYYHHHQ